MTDEPNDMTEAELADWHYTHREELDADQGETVEVDLSPQLSVTISFRLPGAEADAIRQAAQREGLTLSSWIRHACTDALSPTAPGRRDRRDAAELRDAARELEAIARRLDDTTEHPTATST